MIKLLRPIIFAFLTSHAVKELVVDSYLHTLSVLKPALMTMAVDLIRKELGL